MKFAVVLGTRPEIIKLSPVIRHLEKNKLDYFIVHTGQHYDFNMDRIFFKELGLPEPKYNASCGPGTHAEQTGRIMTGIESVLSKERPDLTIILGDTNSTMAGAIVSSKMRIPVLHLEAGCRSFDRNMPEELNRVIADHLAEFLVPIDEASRQNLVKEGISEGKIFPMCNTAVDACQDSLEFAKKSNVKERFGIKGEYGLLTVHRQENTDDAERLGRILSNVAGLGLPIVFPMHPRTKKIIKSAGLESLLKKFKMIEPLGYLDFLNLLSDCKAVFTDSGGVQMEANILKKPCLLLRDTTELLAEAETGSTFIVSDRKDLLEKAYAGIGKRKITYDFGGHRGESGKIIGRCLELFEAGKIRIEKRALV